MSIQEKIRNNRKLNFKFCLDCFKRKGCSELEIMKSINRGYIVRRKEEVGKYKSNCMFLTKKMFDKEVASWYNALVGKTDMSKMITAEVSGLFNTRVRRTREQMLADEEANNG